MTGVATTDLERLVARSDINHVLVSYCQAVDRCDWDGVLACYHDDARDSHGQFTGNPQQLVAWMKKNHEHVRSSMHVLSNVWIQISDETPSLARAESYCFSRKTVSSGAVDPFVGGEAGEGPIRRTVACRYIDTFENRTGVGWRILDRKLVIEWVRRERNDEYLPLPSDTVVSRRDRQDLLYSPLRVEP